MHVWRLGPFCLRLSTGKDGDIHTQAIGLHVELCGVGLALALYRETKTAQFLGQ